MAIVAGRSTESLAVMKNVSWDTLIPDLKLWNSGNGVEPEAWLNAEGNFKLAAAYSLLFWPTFCEYKGMVFVADSEGEDNFENVESWLTHFSGDRENVERMLNHVHLADIHTTEQAEGSVERIAFLGEILRSIYAVKLAADFPGRKFVVEFYQPADLDLREYQLTFYQKHDS